MPLSQTPRKLPEYYARGGPGRGPSGTGRQFQRIAAFDVETYGLGGKLLAASYAIQDGPSGYLTGNSKKIRADLISLMCAYNDCDWFAHNLQYELRYFTEYLSEFKRHTQFFLRTNSDFFMVKIDLTAANPDEFPNGEVLTIRDSNAIWQGDLRSLLAQFCPHLPKGDIDFKNGEIFQPKNPAHIAYSIRDSEGLLAALIELDKSIFENFGVHFRYTAAGTALAAWQRTIRKDERFYNDKQNEDFIRKAYFGGLTFLTDTNYHDKAISLDINSSYPYQMLTHEMPIGNGKRVSTYQPGKLGIYRVKVTTPDAIIIPIIPTRDKHGIMWCRGTFETHTTNIEIEFAVKQGYSFEVQEGVIWTETAKPFKTFIESCMNIRHSNEKGSAYDTTAKLMQNSLYGKFGSRRNRKQFFGELPDDPTGIELHGEYYIKEVYQENMKCLPQWAVFITAHARMHLLGAAYTIEPQNVIYGDTDSLTITKHGDPNRLWKDEKAYGAFKVDKEWQAFRAYAPKCYSGDRYIKGILTNVVAAKGIPKKEVERTGIGPMMLHDCPLLSLPVHYKTLPRLMALLKDGSKQVEHAAQRTITDIANSRSWEPMPGRKVRPRRFDAFAGSRLAQAGNQPADPGGPGTSQATHDGTLARGASARSFDAAGVAIRPKRVLIPLNASP